MAGASISTIDSFCQSIIKNNFADIDLDPRFRVANENERDKEILTRWFGLVDSPESLDEIGQSKNLTTRRVEQLKDRAIAKLVENGK